MLNNIPNLKFNFYKIFARGVTPLSPHSFCPEKIRLTMLDPQNGSAVYTAEKKNV